MYSKLYVLIVALLGLHAAQCCKSFKNIKSEIYTGSEFDPEEEFVSTGMSEAGDAYRIEIFHQDIPELCNGSIKGLKDLYRLIIKNSGIKKLEAGAFQEVPRLTIVDLSQNNIKSIPTGVFNGLIITRINLSSNSITQIDSDAFNSMPHLEVIELDSNNIKQIDTDWFKDSPKVFRIELRYNEITEVPKDAFKNMMKDRALDIWLMNNQIAEVHPLAFRKIEKIETLWLSYNNISELTFESVGKIKNLQIDNNKIKCLSDAFLNGLKVDELNVEGNPLESDCLRKIRKWQKKTVER